MNLTDRLAKAARHAQGIRFDEFMEAALYDEQEGFFARSNLRAGRDGDFLTAPETSPLFAGCVADWILRAQADQPLVLIEAGAGRGTLARALWDELVATPAGRGLTLHLVEKSPANRHALNQQFQSEIQAQRIHLHAEPASLPRGLSNAVLIANELFDNVPVRRVMQTDTLMEIRVRHVRGRFEELLVPAPEDLVDYFRHQNIRLRSGQTAEACPAAPALLAQLIAPIETGRILLIDYGDEARHLYSDQRFPNGTLACHRRHGTDRHYYEDIGAKDVTAHVNFTPLADLLTHAGYRVAPLATQADFLVANGLAQRMAHITGTQAGDPFARLQGMMRAKQLFHPDAMGESFRVLTAVRP